MKETLRLTLALAAFAAVPAFAADKPAAPADAAPAAAPAEQAPKKAPLTKEERAKALNALGWLLSKGQTVGPIEAFGFSDADLAVLAQGYIVGAKGEKDEIGDQFKEISETVRQLLIEASDANKPNWEKRQKYFKEKQEAEASKYDKANKDYLKKIDAESGWTRTQSGLRYKILAPGGASKPIGTSTVTVRYTGKLIDGTVFDSNVQAKDPNSFALDSVIQAWGEGMQKIGKGGKIQLVVPAEIGYGGGNMGSIPPNSTLLFDVELLDFSNEPASAPAPKEALPEAAPKAK